MIELGGGDEAVVVSEGDWSGPLRGGSLTTSATNFSVSLLALVDDLERGPVVVRFAAGVGLAEVLVL